MYQNNPQNYIKELQKYLSAIYDKPLLRSGIFDKSTVEAILCFKKEHGFSDNTTVDKTVFEEMYTAFKEKNKMLGLRCGSKHENKFSWSDEKNVNKMLRHVLRGYGKHTDLRALPFSYFETEKAMNEFMHICGINSEEYSMEKIIDRLKEEYVAQVKLDEGWW